jgi:anti-sigma regulatory factor (Ser/Thr protein kinase)
MNKEVLQLMIDHMDGDNASAPNIIYDAVYELLCDNDVDEQLAEKIADAAFELASSMVVYAGKYI